jgi:hypothetical protein
MASSHLKENMQICAIWVRFYKNSAGHLVEDVQLNQQFLCFWSLVCDFQHTVKQAPVGNGLANSEMKAAFYGALNFV